MDEITQLVTNVGLITTNGPYGDNVMSCEWTHQLSYTPLLIAVCIRPGKATFDNITASREFGVNIAAFDQNVLSSVAGNNHGKDVDKINLLKELRVRFYKAHTINTLMIEDTSLQAECVVVNYIDIGDHPIFIGSVKKLTETNKVPIIYHAGKYFKVGEQILKPEQAKRNEIDALVKKYTKV